MPCSVRFSCVPFSFFFLFEITASNVRPTENQERQGLVFQAVQSDQSLIGEWCVVLYDGKPYPGKIEDTDEGSLEVNCMSTVGRNRFYWPLIHDQIWYEMDNVFCLIPEPNHVTDRHYEIASEYWQAICERLNM